MRAHRRRLPSALIVAVRPRQWLKNLLVLAAPLAAGTLLDRAVLGRTLCTLAAFCALSGAVYLVNDVVDVDSDRRHPVKRRRPVAAGEVRPGLVLAVSGGLVGCAAALSLLAGWRVAAVLALYLVCSLAYTFAVKGLPVFDLALVTAGFVLRAIAGSVAGSAPPSEWFLLVVSFGSLFMVAGKRYADCLHPELEAVACQEPEYTASFLRFVWGLAATVTIVGYALWAFQVATTRGGPTWAEMSVAPFALCVLRYAVDVDGGRAGAPEDVVLGDKALVVLAVVWLALFWMAADVS